MVCSSGSVTNLNKSNVCVTYYDDSISFSDFETLKGPFGEESVPALPIGSGSEDKLVDRSSAKTTGTSLPDPEPHLSSMRLVGLGLSMSS